MYLFWTITGVIFLALDLIKKSKLKLVLASSFLFGAVIAYKFPNKIALPFALFPFYLCVFHYLIKNIFKNEENDLIKQSNLKDYIGKTAIVKKDIGKTLSIDGIGQIEFENNTWQAKSIDDKEIKKGCKVQIISKENMIMNVKVAEKCSK